MKKILLAAVSILFVAAFASANAAHDRGMMGQRGPGAGCFGSEGKAFMDRLNLTPEQTAKVAEMKKEQFKQVAPIREKMFSKRNELKQLWLEAAPSQEKITAVQKEMRDLRDQMQDKMTGFRLEALKVLTPEQRNKIQASNGFRFGHGPGSRWGGR